LQKQQKTVFSLFFLLGVYFWLFFGMIRKKQQAILAGLFYW